MNSLALDDDLVTTIIDIAKSENKQLNQLVREFIDNYLEEKEDLADYLLAEERTKNLDYSKTIPLSEIMAKYVSN